MDGVGGSPVRKVCMIGNVKVMINEDVSILHMKKS